jgi:hypothetical protein
LQNRRVLPTHKARSRDSARTENEQKAVGTYSFMLNTEKYKLATGNYYYKMLIADKSGNTLYTNTKTIIIQ